MKVLMNDDAFVKKGFTISTDKSLIDFGTVYNYLNNDSYWARGISRERLKKAIENSVCFGVYYGNKLAGFTRVVTDMTTFAYICDVFILPDYRRLGLSKCLIQTIKQHPDFQGLRRWSLATLDAHGLYEQFGFTALSRPERWMEIFTPYEKLNQGGEK
jgi:N-acetylglutamate synthase-like GNAT family acetyltransferase